MRNVKYEAALTGLMLVSALTSAGCGGTGDRGPAATESFDSATAGAVPTGWTAVAGTWAVAADATAPSAGKVVGQTAAAAGQHFLQFNAGNYANGEVTVKFNVPDGGNAGVFFRYADADNFYVARFNLLENTWNLFRTVKGTREKVAEPIAGAPAAAKDTWVPMRVEMEEKHLVVYQGIVKVIDYTETNGDASLVGKVGLWTKDAEGVAKFDDFAVSPE
jgi:hypothetical protein